MNKKEIIIVDDHILFANALSKLVNSFSEYYSEKIYKNGAELIEYLKSTNQLPEIILLDVKMPVMDGISTMEWLHEHFPDLKVLVLSIEDDEAIIIKMVKFGANGYLLKDIDPDSLKTAFDLICEQGYYYSDMITNTLIKSINGKSKTPNVEFKDYELELIKLACSELTYKEIADKMNLSSRTIEGYRQIIFQKIGVKTRVGMVMYAIKHGLINLDNQR